MKFVSKRSTHNRSTLLQAIYLHLLEAMPSPELEVTEVPDQLWRHYDTMI